MAQQQQQQRWQRRGRPEWRRRAPAGRDQSFAKRSPQSGGGGVSGGGGGGGGGGSGSGSEDFVLTGPITLTITQTVPVLSRTRTRATTTARSQVDASISTATSIAATGSITRPGSVSPVASITVQSPSPSPSPPPSPSAPTQSDSSSASASASASASVSASTSTVAATTTTTNNNNNSNNNNNNGDNTINSSTTGKDGSPPVQPLGGVRNNGGRLTAGALAGITLAVVVLVALAAVFFLRRRYRGRRTKKRSTWAQKGISSQDFLGDADNNGGTGGRIKFGSKGGGFGGLGGVGGGGGGIGGGNGGGGGGQDAKKAQVSGPVSAFVGQAVSMPQLVYANPSGGTSTPYNTSSSAAPYDPSSININTGGISKPVAAAASGSSSFAPSSRSSYAPSSVVPASLFPNATMVVSTFIPTLPDEMSIRVGEVVRVLAEYDDGWTLCAKATGEKGMVPLECLGVAAGRSHAGAGMGTGTVQALLSPPLGAGADEKRLSRRSSSLVGGAKAY